MPSEERAKKHVTESKSVAITYLVRDVLLLLAFVAFLAIRPDFPGAWIVFWFLGGLVFVRLAFDSFLIFAAFKKPS